MFSHICPPEVTVPLILELLLELQEFRSVLVVFLGYRHFVVLVPVYAFIVMLLRRLMLLSFLQAVRRQLIMHDVDGLDAGTYRQVRGALIVFNVHIFDRERVR